MPHHFGSNVPEGDMEQHSGFTHFPGLPPYGSFNIDMPPFENFSQYNALSTGLYLNQQTNNIPTNPGAGQPKFLSLQERLHKLEQHYEQVLTRIAELERQLLEGKETHALTQCALDRFLAEEAEGRKRKKQKGFQESDKKSWVQSLIHSIAKGLIKVGHKDPKTGEKITMYPHPRGPDEVAQPDEWRPEWDSAATTQVNQEFINHVVNVAVKRVEEDSTSANPQYSNATKDQLTQTMKIFFRSMQNTYKAQTTEGEKLAELCCGVKELRAKHGKAATVGAEQLVLTEWVSSEHTDPGELTQGGYEQYEDKIGGGSFETRTKGWPSDECHKKNVNNDLPMSKKGCVPYAWMVDLAWKAEAEKDDKKIATVDNPVEFTIFSLSIQLTDLDKEDQAYLADSEDA
ncbi:hypothetical protein DFH07DRAFT_952552 [Mycena maculata]|uniref:Uncharacterized protein n=1 Tax=Mycena maculata TaxID=230809 RepID=A0AAD7K0H5_9AGAR|nr:hypothetical protein DFH07DRAFT_952552 [Mycena maculata]